MGRDNIAQVHDAEVQQKNKMIHVVMECGDIDVANFYRVVRARRWDSM